MAEDINLQIQMLDNRRNGKVVGRKTDQYQVELASISLSGELSNDIRNAITLELENRRFNLATMPKNLYKWLWQDGIQELVDDRAFIQALVRANQSAGQS